MRRTIEFYMKRDLLLKDKTVKSLTNGYLNKAKNNLITLKILSEIQDDKKFRKKLDVPNNYSTYEWIVISGYYAMYAAALALVAKIGYRSKIHAATLLLLEEFFVKKKHLDKEDILLIKNAQFQKDELEKLSDARHKREIAQYSVTKLTTKQIAEKINKEAYVFVDKCEQILGSL
jgi:uncharacterized protein (UPF0332 family)